MSMSTLFRCLTCCLAAVGLASWSQAPRPADMILVNGNVITVDDAQPRAQAVAIAAGVRAGSWRWGRMPRCVRTRRLRRA